MMSNDVVKVEKLKFTVGAGRKSFSLCDISFSVPRGCVTGLIGENGAGKTTLLYLILNMYFPESGKIFLFGDELKRENIATKVGNSHETVSPEKQASYTSLIDADTYCDQMNNIMGRTLGKDSNLSNKELALKALDIFHDAGLYTVSQNKDGSYSVGITRINHSDYNTAHSETLKRNHQRLLE